MTASRVNGLSALLLALLVAAALPARAQDDIGGWVNTQDACPVAHEFEHDAAKAES